MTKTCNTCNNPMSGPGLRCRKCRHALSKPASTERACADCLAEIPSLIVPGRRPIRCQPCAEKHSKLPKPTATPRCRVGADKQATVEREQRDKRLADIRAVATARQRLGHGLVMRSRF